MGKLIIIEGTDGSGKQTQSNLIYERLLELKGSENVKKISFPNYESKASEPLKMYLGGEFGKNANDVNAYAASIMFAVDRFASFKTEWGNFYNNGGIVISDRYTTSNMVHQASKINDENEREKYLNWLIDLEWNKVSIPKPDLVFFLDMPYEFSQKLIQNRDNKITGEKEKDIHENDENHLKNAYDISKELAIKYGWIIINCIENEKIRSINEINDEIIKYIKKIF